MRKTIPLYNEVKIKTSATSKNSIESVIKLIKKSNHRRDAYEISDSVSIDVVIQALECNFDNIRIERGIQGGCYGARDGKTYNGLTVYLGPTNNDRWIDEDGDETVCYWTLLNEFGQLRGKDESGIFERWVSMSGLEVELSDNSYNYEGIRDNCYGDTVIQYQVVMNEDGDILASVEFHCGGDVRGNYSMPYLFEFSDMEDFLSVVHPLPRFDEAHEFAELKLV